LGGIVVSYDILLLFFFVRVRDILVLLLILRLAYRLLSHYVNGQLLLFLVLLLLLLLFAPISGYTRCCAPKVWSFDKVSTWVLHQEY
jgi:hypothetical protein